jgi:hypothetical protein
MKTLKNLARSAFLVSVLCLAITGCSEDEKPKRKATEIQDPSDQDVESRIIKIENADGVAIAGAQYLIGTAQDAPFQGNYGVTNSAGEILIPVLWTAPEMITIDAPGYLRATYFETKPLGRKFKLTKKFQAVSELRGKTSGHPVRNKDNIIDFSFVMSAMTRQDLLNFQIQKVLSPLNDTIKAVGQEISIPSNISLPKQTEKKFFFDVNLDKPQYRLQFPKTGVQRVFIARGRFPFNSVVDGFLEKNDIIEMINFFSINGGSLRDVNLLQGVTNLDVEVNDLTFQVKKTFKAPVLKNNEVMIALAATDNNGYLIPTDFKRVTSQQSVNLSIWQEFPIYLAQVLKNQNEFDFNQPGVDRISAILSTFDNDVKSEFLPLINNPTVKNKMHYAVPAVTSATLNPMTTYAVISDVKTKNEDGVLIKEPVQVWEVYAPKWVTEIKLPNWEWNKVAPLTRMEVSIVGSVNPTQIPLGPEMLENATHVTRSSIDF